MIDWEDSQYQIIIKTKIYGEQNEKLPASDGREETEEAL